jgi:hypothetical protein
LGYFQIATPNLKNQIKNALRHNQDLGEKLKIGVADQKQLYGKICSQDLLRF